MLPQSLPRLVEFALIEQILVLGPQDQALDREIQPTAFPELVEAY
ncbi:MAG: hypothetical protein AB7O88_22080 [Reyranellaceae bacterium]